MDVEAIHQLYSSKRDSGRDIEKHFFKKLSATERPKTGGFDLKGLRKEEPDFSHMTEMKVNRGSFFYNENDTLDVVVDNSSISSSEEFLSHCRDTIEAIDLMPYINCSERMNASQQDVTWSFSVNESDFYYFIFSSDNNIEANVINFRVEVNRTLYDVSDRVSSQKCSNSSECIFPFHFMKSMGVIVDYGESNVTKLENLQTFALTSICQPRSMVYTVFILLVPFIIFLFAFR